MLKINETTIGLGNPPYIIAELSANHNGSLERAKLSIKAAKESGANAIKFQTYTADTMTIETDRSDFLIRSGPWQGKTLYELYKEAHTPFEWHEELFSYARQVGITPISSPFDETAVDLLESLSVSAYKVASFEITDLPLIKYIAKTKKPILMSTGMASKDEIHAAINAAVSSGCNSILLFHCISSYPAPIEDSNLLQILNLRKTFGVEVGLSDHSIGNIASIVAVAHGASAIEKHFTLSRDDKGPDSDFSIEPAELSSLCIDTYSAWKSLGVESFSRPQSEEQSKPFRRSIYFIRDLKAGEVITESDIKKIRPGFGLNPCEYPNILGKRVKKNVFRGDPVSFDVIARE